MLPNGKVLVAGGLGASGSLASAELYDPATGAWSATGSLATARDFHSATLLPNGKVLVAGGSNGSFLGSAELYDPATGAWSATGSLATARDFHSATLLPNGKVLVAGGYNGSYLASAELYDPDTGAWSATESLATARSIHSATLLPNGKVLVAGGLNGSYLASAELYNPATGAWSATVSLATARASHTATLLPNGKVLVAGGYNGSSLASAELFDPNSGASGSWSATGSLATARYAHSATLLPNGKVLVAGGSNGSYLGSAELYDPATGAWSATGSLATARYVHSATLLPNGKVLVAGGLGASPLGSAELYDVGLGFLPAWQPQIATASSFLTPGNKLNLTGSRFQGISQASSGTVQDSSTNYPVVQLRRLENEQVTYLPVDPASGWSDSSFTSAPVTGFPFGPALVTIFTNGIPSDARYLLVTAAATPTLSTQASAGTTAGNPISDAAMLSGGLNPTGTIMFRLYGPNDATCGGAVVFSSNKSVNGNGSYSSDPFTPTAAGTYRWVASYSGDVNNNGVNGACNDANESVVVAPAPTPTPTPRATPTATPTATPGLVANVSTRLAVGTGDNVLIEGFIVQGSAGSTKKIMVRAIGPSLIPFGITDALANPTLEIHDASNAIVASNNNWKTTQIGGLITSDQSAEIGGSGLAPSNDLESAIIANLAPGSYTAVVRGVNNTTGTGVVDAYDLSGPAPAQLANIATRGLVQPGDKLMIAGFIIQNGSVKAVIRAIGPSLKAFGISNALPDTTLQLRDQNGVIVKENDDWKSDPQQAQELQSLGLQPSNDLEAALIATIPPGQYTAQVRGKPETTGIGVVEAYFLQ